MDLKLEQVIQQETHQVEHTFICALQKIHSQHQQESQQQRGKLCGH